MAGLCTFLVFAAPGRLLPPETDETGAGAGEEE
jgi:hypothetical protein